MWINSVVTALLASRLHGLLSRSLIALRIVGRVSGRSYVIPVDYAQERNGDLVVFPAGFDHKVWWRNFREPMRLQVLYRGAWRAASGRLVPASDDDVYLAAVSTFQRAYPRVIVPPTAPLVVIRLDPDVVAGTIDSAANTRQRVD